MDLIPASSQMSFWGDWNKGGGSGHKPLYWLGAGNLNLDKEPTLDELDLENVGKLSTVWRGRVHVQELEQFLPPPPEELTVGRDEVTVRDIITYWGKCREGSILRRRIACNCLAGHHGKYPLDYQHLQKVQNTIRVLFDRIASEIGGFKGHPYLLEEIAILAPEPASKSSRKMKQKSKKK